MGFGLKMRYYFRHYHKKYGTLVCIVPNITLSLIYN